MRTESMTYQVMPGEPHLGTVTEETVYATNREIAEELLGIIEGLGEVPEKFDFEGFEIETCELLSMDDIEKLEAMLENEEDIEEAFWRMVDDGKLDEELELGTSQR